MTPKSIFVLLCMIFLLPSVSITADATANVTLAWDPVDGDDIAYYRVYPRQAGEPYDYEYDFEEVEGTYCTLMGFDPSKAYYFVVRAVDTDGNTSGDSNEVCWDPSNSGQCAQGVRTSLDGDANGDSFSNGCFISTMLGI